MDITIALGALIAITTFLLGYIILIPKSNKGFNPSNEEYLQQNDNFRRFSYIANELMLAMPASQNTMKRPKRDLKTESLLIRAGNPWSVTVSEFKVLKWTGAFIGLILGIPISLLIHSQSESIPIIAIIALSILLGFNTPTSKMKDLAAKRDLEFKRQLPEALDLISISLAGGMSFPRALAVSIPSMQRGIVRTEFELVSNDIAAGSTTEAALEKFALRAPNDSVKTFARAVQSAIKTNAPLAEILNSRAKASREEFFAYINQKVAQLESKIWMILSPTMLPALLIITVLPSGAQLMTAI